jgi:hypothetical protein
MLALHVHIHAPQRSCQRGRCNVVVWCGAARLVLPTYPLLLAPGFLGDPQLYVQVTFQPMMPRPAHTDVHLRGGGLPGLAKFQLSSFDSVSSHSWILFYLFLGSAAILDASSEATHSHANPRPSQRHAWDSSSGTRSACTLRPSRGQAGGIGRKPPSHPDCLRLRPRMRLKPCSSCTQPGSGYDLTFIDSRANLCTVSAPQTCKTLCWHVIMSG